MSFYDWLHKPKPIWKKNLEICDECLFLELKMSKEELEELLETLDKYKLFENNE